MRDFRVGDSSDCPVCLLALNADVSTGQVNATEDPQQECPSDFIHHPPPATFLHSQGSNLLASCVRVHLADPTILCKRIFGITSAVLCHLQHLKEQAGWQRSALAQLAAATSLHLEPGGSYCLLPRQWLAAWRAFLGASGKRGSDTGQPPGPLPSTVAEAFCTCHPAGAEQAPLLSLQPPAVAKRYSFCRPAPLACLRLDAVCGAHFFSL